MSLDEFVACQQCGTEMYVGAHFCIRCGGRLPEESAPSNPKQAGRLELTDLESWLPGSKEPSSPSASLLQPPPAVEEPPLVEASLAVEESLAVEAPLAVEEPPAVVRAEPQLSLEEVDRGFDFVDEKTTISASLPLAIVRKLSARPEAKAERKLEYSRDDVQRLVRSKQSLKRAGLAGLDLSGLDLEGADLTRADLDGAKLDRAKLRGASLQNASLRNASLNGADLSEANLERADLGGAKLVGAALVSANLRRAELASADLSGANLNAARLSGAELTSAVLVGAKLRNAELDDADLERADLAMADLSEADLESANLMLASLVGTNLQSATLVDGDLTRANASSADFGKASLVRTKLTAANFENASLCDVDASGADLRGADLSGAVLDGIRVLHATLDSVQVSAKTRVHHIDLSEPGSPRRLEGADALAYIAGSPPARPHGTRYFGQGDLLRDARLDFEPGSKIHVDSRFENCVIVLGEGAELVIGESGVLKSCQISGHGDITVHGCFFERQSPGISGPRSLIVSAKGAVAAGLEQLEVPTAFAFEAGCRLRIKISQTDEPIAAE